MPDPRFVYKDGKQVGLNWKPLAPPVIVARVEKAPSKRGANLDAGDRNKAVRYDYQEIADLWSQGLTFVQIAEKVGCGHTTISTALKAIQPEGYTGNTGPRPLAKCARGHDMAIHGRPKKKGGGRMCMECKRRRDRETWHRNK